MEFCGDHLSVYIDDLNQNCYEIHSIVASNGFFFFNFVKYMKSVHAKWYMSVIATHTDSSHQPEARTLPGLWF